MFLQTIIIMGVMLGLLTLVSTLGGSMNVKEKFEDERAADRGESGQLSGEILRAVDRKMQEVADEFDGEPGAGGDAGTPPERGPGGGGGGPQGGAPAAPSPDAGPSGGSHGMNGGSHGMDGGPHGGPHGMEAAAQGGGLGAVEPYEDMVASWEAGPQPMRAGGGPRR